MLGILFAAVFIALNGFFVAAEFAFVKVSTTLAGTTKVPREDPRVARARAIVSRIESRPPSSATIRSIPSAMPPCGGAP